MKKRLFPLLLLFIALQTAQVQAQVTIGSGEAPTFGALLELKTQQAGTGLTEGADPNNVTSDKGGLLLPRVKIQTTNSLLPLVSAAELSADPDLSFKLAGLMVYNITNNGTDLYPNVYTWDGVSWGTSGVNKSAQPMTVALQPEAFTFYELGTETPVDLQFRINPPKDTEGNALAVTYQWFQITGNNLHIVVGTPIDGATSAAYTPINVIKGTTRDANNTGFYKYYCEASSNGTKLKSNIAEVAVGCGAKNNLGEWISFMCFNLGAQNNSTIAYQRDTIYNASVASQQRIYGSLFQWGRIADGHELRTSASMAFGAIGTADIGSGVKCGTTPSFSEGNPYLQVKQTSAWSGKYITGSSNWTPIATNSDLLWRNGRFIQNDPCTHYKTDGKYQTFWYDGTATTISTCDAVGTAWRTPTQSELADLYRSGTNSGTPSYASANTWFWNGSNGHGFEIRPYGTITTLFLPATGHRRGDDAAFISVGVDGTYWSVNAINTSSYFLGFLSSQIYQGIANEPRSFGCALRCIKDQ